MNKTHVIGVILSVFSLPVLAEGLTAYDVMKKVDDRYDGDTGVGSSKMILIDSRDRQRVRDFSLFRKDDGEDTKTISFFSSPADIQGTAYLNYDWDDETREDDSWLYLPALQKVKRIAAGDKSDPFLGSDFSYADINGQEFTWYDYTFINDSEEVDGQDCWVIEVVPKPEFKDKAEETTGNLKSHTWVRKDNFVQVRGKIWVKRGDKVKYFSASDLQLIDEVWTPMKLQMITTKKDKREHASIIQVETIEYNKPLNDELFSTETMQRGIN
jgi:hypothetical protein